MVTQLKALAIAITLILSLTQKGSQAKPAGQDPPATTVGTVAAFRAEELDKILPIRLKHPAPLPSFWEKLAKCETGGNWQDHGKWGGGLGIYVGTWKAYGGYEFAKHPGGATKDQQITVAKRIAIEGYQTKDKFLTLADAQNNKPWFQEPVGFSGWGCVKSKSTGKWRIGKPSLTYYEPSTVVVQRFRWGQKGKLVGSLQAIIGARQDMVYGPKTWVLHVRYLLRTGGDLSLAPNPKFHRPKNVSRDPAKRCTEFDSMARIAGFPTNEITTVSYVMWKESRCNALTRNKKDPGIGSFGLMQINSAWITRLTDAGIIKKVDDLYDPQTNLRAAFYVWTESIRSNNYGWDDWYLW